MIAIVPVVAPAVAGFAAFLVLHVLVWQWLPAPRKGVLALCICAAAAYAIMAVAAEYRLALPLWRHICTSLPLFAFLTVFYFHLYFGIDRSLSIRILGELVRSDTNSITMEALEAVYPRRDMIERRVAVLLEKGCLEQVRPGVYACTARGRFLTRLALIGKRLYNLRAAG